MSKISDDGFGVAGILLVMVVFAGLGGTCWYVWHKHTTKSTTATSTTSVSTSTAPVQTSKPKVTIPSDYTSYSNSKAGFSLAYPTAWGALAGPTDATYVGYTVVTPKITSQLTSNTAFLDRFGLKIAAAADISTGTGKYGANLKPQKENGSYVWKVTDVNPADTTDKVGDTYSPKSFKNTSGITIYDFPYGDEGIVSQSYVFAIKDTFVIITFPSIVNHTTDFVDSPSLTDINTYHNLTKTIANTIQLIN